LDFCAGEDYKDAAPTVLDGAEFGWTSQNNTNTVEPK
jgi:hypothetical protein